MNAKTKTLHRCFFPDGSATRTSARVYTHAVIVFNESPNDGGEPRWGCLSWSQNEAGAHKTARHWSKVYPEYKVVPVWRDGVAQSSDREQALALYVGCVTGAGYAADLPDSELPADLRWQNFHRPSHV